MLGSSFLKTSVGFGGSCFQKDILNLVYISRSIGLEKVANYWEQILIINKHQRDRFAKKIHSLINKESLNNNVCILGWAFKKDTNDTRESAAIYVSDNLIKSNINLNIYDPKVKESQIFFDMNYINGNDKKNKEHISIYNNPIDCIHKTNIIAILTEWDEFKSIDFKKISKNKLYEMNKVISDTAEYGCYLFSHECVPLLAEFMRKIDTDVIGKGLESSGAGVDNAELIAVNEKLRSHPIEIVGKNLRKHMTAMKKAI